MRALLAFLLVLAAAAPLGAVGPENSNLELDPDYRDFRRLVVEENWTAALPILDRLRAVYPDEPEVPTWQGFVHRRMRDYPTSQRFYDEALRMNADYLPALEYQGMWFVETGDLNSAQGNLARIEELCGRCHEWQDLAEAITRAGGMAVGR